VRGGARPSGRRKDAAFCCPDLDVRVAFLLETYARRWTLEGTLWLRKGWLGFEEPQNQTALAVRRTAPFAGLVFALVVLWYAAELPAGRAATWVARPWDRRTAAPAFADVLAALHRAGSAAAATWRPPAGVLTPPCPPRRRTKAPLPRRAFTCSRIRAELEPSRSRRSAPSGAR
jgi:hypothetical protein